MNEPTNEKLAASFRKLIEADLRLYEARAGLWLERADLSSAFDVLAEEVRVTAMRAHQGADVALAAIQASEARLDALAAKETG